MKKELKVESRGERILKGAIAGAVAGFVASYVMDQFQDVMLKVVGDKPADHDGEPATVKAATAISEEATGHSLNRQQKKYAGPMMHYAMGAASGAIYGALAEIAPATTAGGGTLFGSALWLVADEIALPALGLSKPPLKVPATKHGEAYASHLVYSWTSNLMRNLVRRAL